MIQGVFLYQYKFKLKSFDSLKTESSLIHKVNFANNDIYFTTTTVEKVSVFKHVSNFQARDFIKNQLTQIVKHIETHSILWPSCIGGEADFEKNVY